MRRSRSLTEYAIELPASSEGELTISVRSDVPYRAFHWFALQPET